MATSLDRLAAFSSSKRSDTYKYEPLHEESSQIRLLTLHPDRISQKKIHLDLHTEQLTTGNWPEYEALSYAWGSTTDLVDIFIGKAAKYKLGVTRNLESALRHLRYPDKPRVLWIDAICVNQKDMNERGQQVKRMANLYRMACRVVVWLGAEENNSKMAIQTMERLSSKIEVSYKEMEMWPSSTQASESHWADESVDLPFDDEEWWAIFKLLDRTWFERLWTRQEISLANSDAIIICGHDTIPWQMFRKFVFCLYANTYPDGFTRALEIKTRAFNLCDSENYSEFSHLAYLTTYCKCTDPRDRVYALLSMVSTSNFPRIDPSYTKSPQEVYEDLFVKFTARSGELTLLKTCELQNSSDDLPTWVTNWSKPIDVYSPDQHFAAGLTKAEISYPVPGVLRVNGLQSATVHQAENFRISQDFQNGEELVDELERMALHLKVNHDTAEAFYHAICVDIFSDTRVPPYPHLPDKQSLLIALSEARNTRPYGQEIVLEYLRRYIFKIKECLVHRCCFTTRDGRFGIGPPGTKANDLVCILLGCDVPIILRPIENKKFQVVGGGYCNDIMAGEAILGSLPDNFSLVLHRIENHSGATIAFMDRETKTAQLDDPRLGALPVGWKLAQKSDGISSAAIFVKDEKGAVPTASDPRLTVQSLKERGVDLRTFDLV